MESLQSVYRGYHLFNEDLNKLPQSSKITVNTINQYSFCIAEEDPDFKRALEASDVLLPDGIGIVVASKATNGVPIKKISGADLHKHQLVRLNQQKGRCFYLGSSENTLNKIKERLQKEYPEILCESYSPPFKKDFTAEENAAMIQKINEFKPDVLFVGMTAPKQEKWTNVNKDKIDARVICSIGAVFDFYAGTVKRPSNFWIKMGLEWFIRLCKEPKRMWKRYLYYGPIFVYILLKEILLSDLSDSFTLNEYQKQKSISN
ncbi:MAG: N-acetylglucosaminyldiphosphoundecaprenol N-acetyl-beta-D-mannosaminyltransferase [Mucilaginibacter sp.]|nr:N-acetylglucosaminyldiphosphoundecaprenol N-acetyl-beta-D-mannosaminyltransferase [Mucilaginibacter sp.]